MKKHLSLILVLLPVLFLALPALAQERKKVGVVLSGGGAKGVAHIQALKVIEEAGIPIDYIVGTSMGSIIGGLYSIGYTPQQLDSMVRKQDWMFLLSDRVKRSAMSLNEREKSEKYVFSFPFTKSPKDAVSGGIIKGQNLANLFTELTVGYHDSVDFNKLPIPFACVSQNIVNGEQIVFHNGILATAMRASMAIPGVFTPVRKDSMILIDGGMINNYPVDVARSMGADIIIGVDVQNNLKGIDKLNSAPDILSQIIDLTTKNQPSKQCRPDRYLYKGKCRRIFLGQFYSRSHRLPDAPGRSSSPQAMGFSARSQKENRHCRHVRTPIARPLYHVLKGPDPACERNHLLRCRRKR